MIFILHNNSYNHNIFLYHQIYSPFCYYSINYNKYFNFIVNIFIYYFITLLSTIKHKLYLTQQLFYQQKIYLREKYNIHNINTQISLYHSFIIILLKYRYITHLSLIITSNSSKSYNNT